MSTIIARQNKLITAALSLILVIAFLIYCVMLTPDRFGSYYDDSIYVTAAKSLATGEGYRMISLPVTINQTLIPPVYPFLLSLIWRIYPQFPENLTWMMLLSIVATLAFLAISYRFLVVHNYAPRWQALTVVALGAINWRMMLLATSILSETVFALLSVIALYLAEENLRRARQPTTGVLVGVMAGLVFLTRTSGVVLLIAVTAYYVIRRERKKALLPLIIGGAFLVGWALWSVLGRTPVEGAHASYYGGYAHGIYETIGNLQALNNTSRLMVHLNIIGTNAVGLLFVSIPMECLGLRDNLPAGLLIPVVLFSFVLFAAGFLRGMREKLRLLHIYILCHLGLHLVVPGNSYDRYLMPMIPFLLVFFVTEFGLLATWVRKGLATERQILDKALSGLLGLALIILTSAALFSNWSGIYWSLNNLKETAINSEDRQAVAWIRSHTDPSDVLICYRDQMYYLHTGRKAVRSIPVSFLDVDVYKTQKPSTAEQGKAFLDIITESKARYFLLNSTDFKYRAGSYGDGVKTLIDRNPEIFTLVFESPSQRITIYRIEGSRLDHEPTG